MISLLLPLGTRYSQTFNGAVASAAPMKANDDSLYGGWFDKVNGIFRENGCDSIIAKGYDALLKILPSDSRVQEYFRLCDPLKPEDISDFLYWTSLAFASVCEFNYPYPVVFPSAFPANYSCSLMKNNTSDPLKALADAVVFGLNFTIAPVSCFVPNVHASSKNLVGEPMFDFQKCSQIVIPVASQNKVFHFLPEKSL